MRAGARDAILRSLEIKAAFGQGYHAGTHTVIVVRMRPHRKTQARKFADGRPSLGHPAMLPRAHSFDGTGYITPAIGDSEWASMEFTAHFPHRASTSTTASCMAMPGNGMRPAARQVATRRDELLTEQSGDRSSLDRTPRARGPVFARSRWRGVDISARSDGRQSGPVRAGNGRARALGGASLAWRPPSSDWRNPGSLPARPTAQQGSGSGCSTMSRRRRWLIEW